MTPSETEVYDVLEGIVLADPDAPLWAQELAIKQSEMTATLTAILARFDSMAGEVKPVIYALSQNPMFKMFVGKKGK